MNSFRISSTAGSVSPPSPQDWIIQAGNVGSADSWDAVPTFILKEVNGKELKAEADGNGNGKVWLKAIFRIDGCSFHALFNLLNHTYSDGDYSCVSTFLDDTGIVRLFELSFSKETTVSIRYIK